MLKVDRVFDDRDGFSVSQVSVYFFYRVCSLHFILTSIETISCLFILFHFANFLFSPFFLGPEGGPERGPRFVYTHVIRSFNMRLKIIMGSVR